MPRDKELKKLAKMIDVDPSVLRFGESRPGTLPLMVGEHVTDEDELALLRAYRGLTTWARNALRRRAVQLLEEFSERGPHNPHGRGRGTQ